MVEIWYSIVRTYSQYESLRIPGVYSRRKYEGKKEEKRIFSNTFLDNIDERSIYKITLLTTFKSVSGGDACMYGHTLDLLDFEWIRS